MAELRASESGAVRKPWLAAFDELEVGLRDQRRSDVITTNDCWALLRLAGSEAELAEHDTWRRQVQVPPMHVTGSPATAV